MAATSDSAATRRALPSSPWPEPGTAEPAEEVCRQVLSILGRVGDKWSVLVIGALAEGTLRFGELHRTVTGISQRMLTLTLRQLERDGLLTRTVYASVPPRVDYALTGLGETLLDAVIGLSDWARDHRVEINENRSRYDEGTTGPSSDAGTARRSTLPEHRIAGMG
ncbi:MULTISPECIES: winged helix-turn-helix transcriptional regulator [Actinoalloteichus]|uniref:Transcriptional regulator, HxlR family n=1 Tax=Actinoalloteichus fjordicus TaxID=1612552 RepID=A0AAC9LB30_9PSEU|nr:MULTISPECIES: helix-turn-helix domain-containing protein [Actinoalloteichus]APU14311.1 transcriptional regulator, HxlR family [Actinoalloteichus fjordicus]APU20280.1 transcriptional regulator, HxlR family [Actinoalloteichus sp. GBA129-24]